MSFAFNEKNEALFQQALSKYPQQQAALMPTLWLAQRQNGHLSLEVQEYVARRLNLSPVHVHGVATFYTMYRQKPVGRFHLQVCRTLSCALAGSERIVNHLKEKYNLHAGRASPDGKFSLEEVECLASCGTAPAMMINETYFENLNLEKLDRLLEKLGRE